MRFAPSVVVLGLPPTSVHASCSVASWADILANSPLLTDAECMYKILVLWFDIVLAQVHVWSPGLGFSGYGIRPRVSLGSDDSV